jgi:uncharacterized protein (TIGR03437 family)
MSMRLVSVAVLAALAVVWPAGAQTPTWDSSGNKMLSGTYYFREVAYALADADGDLQEGIAIFGNITFDGKGNYTMTADAVDSNSYTGLPTPFSTTGKYTIAASGYGYLSSQLVNGASVYGLVSQQGYFVASDTEDQYFDMFVAVPVPSPAATVSALKGSYTLAQIDFSANAEGYGPGYTTNSMVQLNADGAGNLTNVTLTGYEASYGSQAISQTLGSLKYVFQNGAGVLGFPNSSNALVSGQEYLYISPDGNFVFGGSPQGWDMFVGVRTGTGTTNFSGLYYQGGLDEDASTLGSGYVTIDSYYGSVNAVNGAEVGHQRQQYNDAADNAVGTFGYTYGDSFTVGSNGTYSTSYMKYVVGAGGQVRIGAGIGPELGINVALAAPNVTGSGVFIYPNYVVNAGSFAPFTAGLSPGEFVTIAGQNLADAQAVASSLPYPTTLGNVQVMINGNIQAPLYIVNPSYISFVVPYEVTPGSLASIQVITDGNPSNTVTLPVNMTTPGIFTNPANGLSTAAALHADFSKITSSSTAQPGETIQVFMSGLGAVSPSVSDGSAGPSSPLSNTTNTISAYINGQTATVTYAGLAPGLGGVYQMNVTLPTGLASGTYYLDIAGPDSYTSEATIPVGTVSASGSVAQPAVRARPRRNLPGAARRPLRAPTFQK